jgi:predicted dehydrogenase
MNARLVAVCDISKETAARTAKEWGIPNYYTDFEKMLQETTPSIVSILTPPQFHAELATYALKSGVSTLIEKPLTMTTQDADRILNALKQSKGRMNVVYHHLFSLAGQQALRIVRTGELGDVIFASATLLHGVSDDSMGSNPTHWSHSLPGGRITEMLPHPVYLLQPFLGDNLEVDSVYTDKRGDRSWMLCDELEATLHSKNGMGSIYVSFNAPREATTLKLYGTKKILSIDLTNQTLISLGQRTRSKRASVQDVVNVSIQLISATAKNSPHFLRSTHGGYALQYAYRALMEEEEGSYRRVAPKTAYETVRIVEDICKRIRVARP